MSLASQFGLAVQRIAAEFKSVRSDIKPQNIYVWRYTGGAWPAIPASQPAGVSEVRAFGPSYPTSVPSWVGLAANQVPMSYSKVDVA